MIRDCAARLAFSSFCVFAARPIPASLYRRGFTSGKESNPKAQRPQSRWKLMAGSGRSGAYRGWLALAGKIGQFN